MVRGAGAGSCPRLSRAGKLPTEPGVFEAARGPHPEHRAGGPPRHEERRRPVSRAAPACVLPDSGLVEAAHQLARTRPSLSVNDPTAMMIMSIRAQMIPAMPKVKIVATIIRTPVPTLPT